jgi:hypothetical protein
MQKIENNVYGTASYKLTLECGLAFICVALCMKEPHLLSLGFVERRTSATLIELSEYKKGGASGFSSGRHKNNSFSPFSRLPPK